MDSILNHHQSEGRKKAQGFDYYKKAIDYYDRHAASTEFGNTSTSDYNNKLVNYRLMNNQLDLQDFRYVTKPWGDGVGELPAQMANRDIVSSKIKAVLGIEAKRPFNWKIIAVNEEATTRKEQEEFNRLKEFVVSSIFQEMEEEVLIEQFSGKQPTPQELEEFKTTIAEELRADPPEEIRKYMRRRHQDPAEILSSQILAYLIQKLQLKDKFNNGCKHAAISAEEIYWVGEVNGEPELRVINPLYIDYDKSPDVQFIEDGEWASVEYRMTPSEVIREFSSELNATEQSELYTEYGGFDDAHIMGDDYNNHSLLVRVLHVVWKGVTKIGFLTYTDPETGKEEEKIVLSNYKLRKEIGDISIRYEWITQVHEGYKIGKDKYVRMRPLPNQYKDLDNLKYCKLPYIGAVYDYENSQPTSLMDRMKYFQYLYNIIVYRMELLMGQDKGKKVFVNINAVPTSSGIKLKEFEYNLDGNSITYLDTNEEGMRNQQDADITKLVKSIDLSTTSDIASYQSLAAYINQQCGNSVGITAQLEGQIQEREAVSNVNKVLSLSTNILETFFQTHDRVKRNVLQALIECAKVAYAKGRPRKLNYFLDDMSSNSLTIDQELLDNSTYGIFVTDSFKTQENQDTITQLAHAAMQNQLVDLSTVVRILQASTVQEAEEILMDGEERMNQRQQQNQQATMAHEQQMQQMQQKALAEAHTRKLEEIKLTEKLKKEREIAKQAILAIGFAKDNDIDNSGTPDALDAARLILEGKKLDIEASTKEAELSLKREELTEKKKETKKSSQKP